MTDILRLSVPLTFWLTAFSAIYGLQGLVCSPRWPEGPDLSAGRAVLIGAWLVSIALQAAILLALRSPRFASRSTFVRETSQALAVVALIATIWTLAPVAITSICR